MCQKIHQVAGRSISKLICEAISGRTSELIGEAISALISELIGWRTQLGGRLEVSSLERRSISQKRLLVVNKLNNQNVAT